LQDRYVTQPKSDKLDQYFVRAEVVASKLGITSLHLPGSAIRDHFYFFTRRPVEDRSATLYDLLRASPTAAFADLRLCYRIRRLELSAAGPGEELRAIERAFNLLMHPQLRSCYDALLRGADSPALFPYGGGGQCVVSGEQADDGQTFFVRQLLGYLPDQTQRSFRAPPRCVDFYDGYAMYRDQPPESGDLYGSHPPAVRLGSYLEPVEASGRNQDRRFGGIREFGQVSSPQQRMASGRMADRSAQQVIYYGAASYPRTDP
jgi:hypothetical protein